MIKLLNRVESVLKKFLNTKNEKQKTKNKRVFKIEKIQFQGSYSINNKEGKDG